MSSLELSLWALEPKAASLLWGAAPFVDCLAVLGSDLPHNSHVLPPDNGQGPASEADSPSGDGQPVRATPQHCGVPARFGGGKMASLLAAHCLTKGRAEGAWACTLPGLCQGKGLRQGG